MRLVNTIPHACLAAVLSIGLGATADALRPPGQQITARVYQSGISGYRLLVHPVTGHFIHCRFRPTCSHYSSVAVARFGILRGLKLTAIRLWSCSPSVKPGTQDPVPDR